MTSTRWMIVHRHPRANRFQRTAIVVDTWDEAVEEARRYMNDNPGREVWYVAEDETQVLVESGRWVQIAPSAQMIADAKAREQRISRLLEAQETNRLGWRPLIGTAYRFRSDVTTDREAAEVLVAEGWDWRTVCQANS